MKKIIYLAICACAFSLGSCVKDAEVTTVESTKPSTDGNTTFAFSIQNSDDSTKGTGSVEDSGVHDQGEAEEYAVNTVDVYLFNSASHILVKTISLEGINLVNETASDKVVRYESDEFDVEEGTYSVFAVANSSNTFTGTTLEQFLAYEDDSYANNSLMATIPDEGFIMSNRGSENQLVNISANEDKTVEITLERVVVKIDVAQDKDLFELKDASSDVYASIKLQNYMLVNLATNYFLFRHVADLTNFVEPTYSYASNFGNVSDNNGYVIDPYFFSKDAASAGSFTNADGFFFQPLADVATSPRWSMMPASTTSSVSYCLENTLYQEAQLNGYTTGVVFQAKVLPSAIYTDSLGSTTSTTPAMVYYCNYKFYNSVATLESCVGGDIVYYDAEGNTVDVDDSSSTADLEAAGITRLTLVNGDYPCYYNYWIKHYDNEDADTMGVMEFGVVRNNHYQLSINSIAGLGTGEPEVEPEQPDETNETLTVSLNVIPWVVRDQGEVELK
ncbi:MAG: Mfa1 family fimbria major subunit [Rikenellaceae bacterium]